MIQSMKIWNQDATGSLACSVKAARRGLFSLSPAAGLVTL